MAVSKNSKTGRGATTMKDQVTIKRVKKANMWCRTEFKDGKQTIEWFMERPK